MPPSNGSAHLRACSARKVRLPCATVCMRLAWIQPTPVEGGTAAPARSRCARRPPANLGWPKVAGGDSPATKRRPGGVLKRLALMWEEAIEITPTARGEPSERSDAAERRSRSRMRPATSNGSDRSARPRGWNLRDGATGAHMAMENPSVERSRPCAHGETAETCPLPGFARTPISLLGPWRNWC